MRNHNHCFSRATRSFIILWQPAWTIQPCKSTFNNPAFWENLKPFLFFDLHRNINSDIVKFIKSIPECSSITAICTSRLNGRIPIKCFFKRVYAALCIVNICRMNVEYTGDFPSYLLQCAVFFPSFFPRHIHDFLHNTLFLRSVNRFVRNLVLPSCLFSCYFDKMLHHFVPYAVLSCSAIKTPYRIMWRIVMW